MAKEKLYLVDPNTEEVIESHETRSLPKALRIARAEDWVIVIATSEEMAEDIATGTMHGPIFSPAKTKRRASKKARRTSRR